MSDDSKKSSITEAVRSIVREELARHMVVPHPGVVLASSHAATVDALYADIRRAASSLPCADKAVALGLTGWTYVLQVGAGPSMCFKIGMSVDLGTRLRELQMATPYRLTVVQLFHGDRYEKDLHMQFHDERLHGEWFHGPKVAEWALRRNAGYQCDSCSRREQW